MNELPTMGKLHRDISVIIPDGGDAIFPSLTADEQPRHIARRLLAASGMTAIKDGDYSFSFTNTLPTPWWRAMWRRWTGKPVACPGGRFMILSTDGDVRPL